MWSWCACTIWSPGESPRRGAARPVSSSRRTASVALSSPRRPLRLARKYRVHRVDPPRRVRSEADLPAHTDHVELGTRQGSRGVAVVFRADGLLERAAGHADRLEHLPVRVSEGGLATDVGWSPDGNTVYYWLAAPGDERTLVAARLGAGPTPSVASRDTLRALPAGLGPWDMHPDGSRFITTRQEGREDREAGSRQTIIIVNWLEELRRRMGEGG